MSKAITVRTLRERPRRSTDPTMLRCAKCGTQSSSDPGDYFAAKPSTIFKCCGHNMALVTKHVLYRAVEL